jgi:hypothetical protein
MSDPVGSRARTPDLEESGQDTAKSSISATPNQHPGVPFLRRRYARAIEKGDDEHGRICRALLDRLLNGARS